MSKTFYFQKNYFTEGDIFLRLSSQLILNISLFVCKLYICSGQRAEIFTSLWNFNIKFTSSLSLNLPLRLCNCLKITPDHYPFHNWYIKSKVFFYLHQNKLTWKSVIFKCNFHAVMHPWELCYLAVIAKYARLGGGGGGGFNPPHI